MGVFTEHITISASKEAVWKVLADIGAIHEWNPGVSNSRATTSGEIGLGSGRRCELGGKNYLDEKVVEWNPGTSLTMRIVDTNMPFKTADIRFTLNERDDTTVVTVTPNYELKFGIVGRIFDVLMVRRVYRKGMVKLLEGLKIQVEESR